MRWLRPAQRELRWRRGWRREATPRAVVRRVITRTGSRFGEPDPSSASRRAGRRARIDSAAVKIAVCVKQVPEAGVAKRIDPQTKRLDRSGEAGAERVRRERRRGGAAASRRRPARARSCSSRWARPARSRRCARRWRWAPTGRCSSATTLPPAPISSPRATCSPPSLEREQPDLVLFGQQASDSDGAVLWAAVAERLRRPLVSQAAELTVDGGKVQVEAADRVRLRPDRGAAPGGRRRLGRDQRAALPVAEGDHGREVEAAGDALARRPRRRRGPRRARPARRRRSTSSSRRPRAATRFASRATRGAARRSSSTSRRGSSSSADPRLPRAPRRRDRPQLARRALEGRRARRRRRRRRRGFGRARPRGPGGRARRAHASTSPTIPRSRRRSRSRASTCSPRSSRDKGFDTVLFGQSVLAADLASGLAARLDAGLNWDLTDIALEGGGSSASGRRSPTPCWWTSAGSRARGSRSSAPARSTRRRRAAPPRSRTSRSQLQDFSTGAVMLEQAHEERTGRRSRTPT